MSTWWYFKPSVYADMSEQTKAAMTIEYDTENAESWWLGKNPLSKKRRGSRNIDDVINGQEEFAEKRTYRPVQEGDTVWVYNVHCLGGTNKKILSHLNACHAAGVHLRIYTLAYHDIDRDDGTNDYLLLSNTFKELEKRGKTKKKKRKAGRPVRNINIYGISNEGQKILADYDAKNGKYTRDTAIEAMQGTPKDGGIVSKGLFYKLLKEYRSIKKYKEKKIKK